MKRRLSQLEVELAIGASTGSLSRIESGQVNPTKETVLSLADVYKLTGAETADLFGIELEEFILQGDKLNSIKSFLSDQIIKFGVGQKLAYLEKMFGYNGSSLSMYNPRNESLYLKYYSRGSAIRFAERFIFNRNSYLAQPIRTQTTLTKLSVIQNRIIVSRSVKRMVSPPMKAYEADLIQRVMKIRCAVSVPIHNRRGEVAGVVNLSTSREKEEINEIEINALRKMCSQIGIMCSDLLSIFSSEEIFPN